MADLAGRHSDRARGGTGPESDGHGAAPEATVAAERVRRADSGQSPVEQRRMTRHVH